VNPEATIRPTQLNDVPHLVQLTRETGVFRPLEMETLAEVFADYFAGASGPDHHARTLWVGRQIAGFTYFAPAPMTEQTWYLYWIAVAPDQQGKGYGSLLLRLAEEEVRGLGGRLLFIETSGLPHYARTRHFYLRHGYEQEATLRDFYAAGDDMVVFRKALR